MTRRRTRRRPRPRTPRPAGGRPDADPAETTTIPAAATQALPPRRPSGSSPPTPCPTTRSPRRPDLPHLPPPGPSPTPVAGARPAPAALQPAPRPATRHGPQGPAPGRDHARSAVDARGGLRPRGQPHRRGPRLPAGRADDDRRPRRACCSSSASPASSRAAAPLRPCRRSARRTAYRCSGRPPHDGRRAVARLGSTLAGQVRHSQWGEQRAQEVRHQPRGPRPVDPAPGRPLQVRQRDVARHDGDPGRPGPLRHLRHPARGVDGAGARPHRGGGRAPTTARRARRSGRSATSTRASWTPTASRSSVLRRCRPCCRRWRPSTASSRLGAALGRLARDGVDGLAAALRVARRALARGLRRLPRAGRARAARRVLLPRGEVRRDPDGLRRPHRPPARPRRHPRRRGQGRRASWRSRRCSRRRTGTT